MTLIRHLLSHIQSVLTGTRSFLGILGLGRPHELPVADDDDATAPEVQGDGRAAAGGRKRPFKPLGR
jgi:hypothetical protein